MEKILCMNVAASLTQAACGAVPGGTVGADGKLDDSAKAKNLHVWETFRVFHHAVAGALSANNWPSPDVPAGSLPTGILQSLLPLMTEFLSSELGKKLLEKLGGSQPALPNPPADLPT